MQMLHAWPTTPAVVLGRTLTVLAHNPLGKALRAAAAAAPRPGRVRRRQRAARPAPHGVRRLARRHPQRGLPGDRLT
uniref:MmyB family transcriptional regulator n=1 Tax=Actinomadura physcomitrii TaxID=2650748 RepID=UPI0038B38DE5